MRTTGKRKADYRWVWVAAILYSLLVYLVQAPQLLP
jgi:hypothetical protein